MFNDFLMRRSPYFLSGICLTRVLPCGYMFSPYSELHYSKTALTILEAFILSSKQLNMPLMTVYYISNWAVSTGVVRPLRMREVLGSIPR